LEFRVLGTGSATPVLSRNPSAFVLSIDNYLILIDCGEGTQFQFLKYKVKASRIKHILISHLHGDHYFGLIGLICSFNLNKRTEPLIIFGPAGLNEIIVSQLKFSNTILHFQLQFIKTNSENPELLFHNDTFEISTFPLKHRIPCTGFVIKSFGSKRKIRAELLPSNFPIPYYKMLKNGEDVFDELTGITFKNQEYTIAGSENKYFAYCSDTIYDEGIIQHIIACDLIYHEATFSNDNESRATQTFHSTASQAALIAKKARAKKLVLGHFSSRYKTIDHFLEEANAIFPSTSLAIEGESYII
jgi:ribonuclease Z